MQTTDRKINVRMWQTPFTHPGKARTLLSLEIQLNQHLSIQKGERRNGP